MESEICRWIIEDDMPEAVIALPDQLFYNASIPIYLRVDAGKTTVGYELNFNRYFYTYTPPRPLEDIEADLRAIEGEIAVLLQDVASENLSK